MLKGSRKLDQMQLCILGIKDATSMPQYTTLKGNAILGKYYLMSEVLPPSQTKANIVDPKRVYKHRN